MKSKYLTLKLPLNHKLWEHIENLSGIMEDGVHDESLSVIGDISQARFIKQQDIESWKKKALLEKIETTLK